MMASHQPSQEVQLLFAAEKRASEKISEARKRKVQRLKEAKEEAAADIEKFRAERQVMFDTYEKGHIGSNDDSAKEIDRETIEKLEIIQERIPTTNQTILNRLIGEVVGGVDARLHRNKRVAA